MKCVRIRSLMGSWLPLKEAIKLGIKSSEMTTYGFVCFKLDKEILRNNKDLITVIEKLGDACPFEIIDIKTGQSVKVLADQSEIVTGQ